MSYQVIARKWRPKSFNEVIGQSHISQTLANALNSGRLPHALLFTGPRGTGKTSSARILAKTLRCPNVKDFVPCNECSECDLINLGQSVDVLEIDGASNNGVDAVRELRESVRYMPSSGKHRIYIIDEVHMLSGAAFNALLKTLEEPPEHVVFVLATTEAHKIPNTILSRCQRFDFRRISTREISEHLASICSSESVSAEPDALWAISRQGDGSMRDSQSLLDQVITFSDGSITLQSVVDALGLTDRHLLNDVLQALVERDEQKAFEVVQKVYQSGIDASLFAQDMLEQIRNLLMVKVGDKKAHSLVDLPDSELENLKDLASHLSEEDIHLLFDMSLKGANDIPRSQEPRLVLEMLMMRMARAPRIVDLMNMSFAPAPAAQASAANYNQSAAPKKMASPKTPAAPKLTSKSDPLAEKWSQLVDKIKGVNGMVAAKLEHSYLKSLDDSEAVIAIPEKMKFLHDQVSDPNFQKKLGNYINTFWGQKLKVEIQLENTAEKKTPKMTPKVLADTKSQEKQELDRTQVENHPLIRDVKKIFKTEVEEIKEMS